MVRRLDKFLGTLDGPIDDNDLAPNERLLLKMFRSLPESERDPLLMVAKYLAAKPSDEKLTPEQFDELFEQAKRLQ